MFVDYVVWALMGIFPDNGLARNEEARQLYVRALDQVPEADLRRAVHRWLVAGKRFPVPAELIELAREAA